MLRQCSAAPSERGGSVAVVVVRRTSVDAAQARALAESVAELLRQAGVAVEPPAETLRRLGALGVKDTTKCGGRKACVLELLKQAEFPAGVALSVSQLGADRSIALEALRVSDGSVVAKDAVVLKKDEPLPEAAVASLARELVKQWPAQKAEPAPVAVREPPPPAKPVEPPPVPAPVVEPPQPQHIVLDEVAPAPKSHVPGIILTTAAVVAAGVAAGFAGGAFTARGQLMQSSNGLSPYSGSEATTLANAANQRGAIAGGAAGVAVALGVVAVIAW